MLDESPTTVYQPNYMVSIIIPIYDVEQYLRLCLDNVCKQTYSNLEIILIDDGSPDNCGDICDEYAQKDSRIIVHHVPNDGVSTARNLGLDTAQGEYILFIDPDDIPEKTYVETAMNAIHDYGCDIVTSKFRRIDENGELFQYDMPHNQYDSISELNREEALTQILHNQLESYTWIYVTRRELWNNPKVRFPQGRVLEDAATMYKVIANSSKVVKLTDITYSYRYRQSSATNSKWTKITLDKTESIMERLDFIKTAGLSKDITDSLLARDFIRLVASYYGLARQNEVNRDEINHVKTYLYQYAERMQGVSLPKGTKLRWLLIRLHLDKVISLINRLRYR